MKVELKHLAPYLHYKLMMYGASSIFELHGLVDDNSKHEFSIYLKTHSSFLIQSSLEFSPILRPMSDLTNEIKVNGVSFIPSEEIFGEKPNKGGQSIGRLAAWERNPITWKHYQTQILFNWHFDVFGLIEKGLAININTLKK